MGIFLSLIGIFCGAVALFSSENGAIKGFATVAIMFNTAILFFHVSELLQ